MSAYEIFSGSGLNQGRTTVKHGHGYSHYDYDHNTDDFNLGAWSSGLNPDYGSWGTGTGVLITTTGSAIGEEFYEGPTLTNFVIRNSGTEALVFGINENYGDSSGMLLHTGEAIIFNDTLIHKAWARSMTATTTIDAFGVIRYNPNTR